MQFGTSDAPDLAHKIPMGEGGEGWNEASRYQIWTRSFPLDAPELALVEVRPEGLIVLPGRTRLFHVVPAGVPHRVKHLFGFYRVSESDTMFIRVQSEATVAYTIIVGTHSPDYKIDEYVWFCASCGAELQRVPFQTKRFGLAAFWAGATEQARAFSAGAAHTCAKCGHEHPLAYGFDQARDSAEEAAARVAW